MEPQHDRGAGHDIMASVRQNAGSAGIAAALMIYFGFLSGLLEPTGADLFQRANWIFYHTIRIGGVAMALIAIWSMVGHRQVLIVDAVVSVTIGALFALSGVAMLADGGGGLQTILIIVFGCMFISAGVRNGRVYRLLAPPPQARGVASPTEQGFSRPFEGLAPHVPDSSLASRLRHRSTSPTHDHAEHRPSVPLSDEVLESVAPPPSPAFEVGEVAMEQPEALPVDEIEVDADPPPGGFLASFADEEPKGPS